MYRLHHGLLKISESKRRNPEDVPNACMARACTCTCSAASVAQSLDKGGSLVRCNEKAIQFSSSADIKIFEYIWHICAWILKWPPGFTLNIRRNRLIRPITSMSVVYSQGSQRSFVCAAASGATLSLFIGQSCNSFCDTGEAHKETCCEMEFLVQSNILISSSYTPVASWLGSFQACPYTEDLRLSKADEALLLSVLEGGVENLRQWTQAAFNNQTEHLHPVLPGFTRLLISCFEILQNALKSIYTFDTLYLIYLLEIYHYLSYFIYSFIFLFWINLMIWILGFVPRPKAPTSWWDDCASLSWTLWIRKRLFSHPPCGNLKNPSFFNFNWLV